MMKKKNTLTKILAVVGTILVWLPILAPILFSLIRFLEMGGFMFDYLMPAEGFPLVLVGGGLLIWAAIRAKSQVRWMAWMLGIGIVLLIGGQALAVVTGLASGETEPTGWQWVLVLATIAGYTFTVIGMGSGGIRLIKDLFMQQNPMEK